LIDKAVELGYGAIAITLHGKVLEDERVFDYARQKGLLLIPWRGVAIRPRDVLLYNIAQRELDRLRTLADLRAFDEHTGRRSIAIAAHPYFSSTACTVHFEQEPGSVRCRGGSYLLSRWLNRPTVAVRSAEHTAKRSWHFRCA